MKYIKPLIAVVTLLCHIPVLSAETASLEGKHLFILSGQSNMRKPLPAAFYKVVEKVFGKDRVIVVHTGHPSQPIKGWYKKWKLPENDAKEAPAQNKKSKPNAHLYDILMKNVKKKLGDHQIATVTFVWMQGEADAGKGWGEVYEKAFYGIIDQIKADLKVKKVNYVLGRINDFWTTERGFVHGDMMRELQKKIGDANEHGDWVNTDDLNTGVNPWAIYMFCDGHFPPAAYAVLGERFARNASLLIDPNLKFGDDVFTAVHFQNPDDISSHDAIGKKVTGSEPNEGMLSKLTDGKFAKPEAKDEGWVTFQAEERDNTELLLDLGEQRHVKEIGITLLHDPKNGFPYPKKMVMEISSDGEKWQSLNRRNFTFKYLNKTAADTTDNAKPWTLLVIVPTNSKLATVETRYFRVNIEAPKVLINEIIANPVAR